MTLDNGGFETRDYRIREYQGGGGVRIVADVGGPADAPTVILSHGGGQTRHSWHGAMRALVDSGWRVINFDLRGHGDSGWSANGDYTLGDRADDMRAILADTRGPVGLVGASLGGIAMLYTAATTAGLEIAALILVDIVARPNPAGVQRIVDFMRAHLDGFDDIAAAVDAVAAYNPARRRSRNPDGLRKNLRQRNGRLYWHWDPKITEVNQDIENSALDGALEQAGSALDFPALLVRGLQSDVVTADGVDDMRRYLPQLEVFDVVGASHMVAGDRNDSFNAGVIDFLRRHLPAGRG